jgi:hypothetical protein
MYKPETTNTSPDTLSILQNMKCEIRKVSVYFRFAHSWSSVMILHYKIFSIIFIFAISFDV